MDAQGEFTARVLDSGLRSLAADVAARVEADAASDGDATGAPSFKQISDETEVRLRYLGEAVAAGAPELFEGHVLWTAQSWRARDVPVSLLETTLAGLRDVLASELPEASAAQAVSMVERGIASLEAEVIVPASVLEGEGAQIDRARRFLLALLEMRRRDAADIVFEALAEGASLVEVQTDIVARAQREIGRLWHLGEVHIGEEHAGSRIVEEVLALARERARKAEPDGRRMVACSPAGDLHDIGARMVADALEAEGWEAFFMGANVPAEDLARSLQDFRAELLVLSLGLALHVRTCASTIQCVREALGESAPRILVGGPPFDQAPDLWQSVGADACAVDSRQALAAAERLVPRIRR